MTLFRRVSAFTMVLALLLSMSISVFAADFTNMDEGFAYDGVDTEVNITISENVDNGWYEAKEGKNYNIGTNNGSTLTNAGFDGSGDVVINTDVNSMHAHGDVNVTVNGDVTGVDNKHSYPIEGEGEAISGSDGVYAGDNATVTVNGNVTGGNADGEGSKDIAFGGSAVSVNGNASVTVNGNVASGTATGATENRGSDAVWAFGEEGESASVTVNGNVTGYSGIGAVGAVEVAVTGNVTADQIGVMAQDGASVAVTGDITGGNVGVVAQKNSTITVNGNVAAGDKEYNAADDEYGSSEVMGGTGVYAEFDASVTVTGNVTGGNADGNGCSMAFGGTAVSAEGDASVTVTGNVTGGNAENADHAMGGDGIWAYSNGEGSPNVTVNGNAAGGDAKGVESAQGGIGVGISNNSNVTVTGNATGGDAADGSYSIAVPGAVVLSEPGAEAGSLTVGGTVQAGKGNYEMGDLFIQGPDAYGEETNEEAAIPEITVGACEDIMLEGFSEEEAKQVVQNIKIIGAGKPEYTLETLWNNVLGKIQKAKPGDEITINLYGRKSIPAFIIEAVRKYDVKLIIKWDGGDDLVITKDFTEEVKGNILLKDLAEMLKK